VNLTRISIGYTNANNTEELEKLGSKVKTEILAFPPGEHVDMNLVVEKKFYELTGWPENMHEIHDIVPESNT